MIPILLSSSHLLQPQVIVINLGTNDYSTEPHPSDRQFAEGLDSFLRTVQRDYTHAQIALLCPYKLTDAQCALIEAVAEERAVSYLRLDADLVQSLGCNSHPDQEAQKALSAAINPLVGTLFAASKSSGDI